MEEKTYQTPEIIYEGELEVHAGSVTDGGGTSEELIMNPLDVGGANGP